MPDDLDPLVQAALKAADHLRASLELAAVELEIIEAQLRSSHHKDRESLNLLADLAATAARQAREAIEPG